MRYFIFLLICGCFLFKTSQSQNNPVITSTGACATDSLKITSSVTGVRKAEWKRNGTTAMISYKQLDSVGFTLASAGYSGAQVHQPTAIFIDATGNKYIADRGNDRVQKWLPGADSGVTVAFGAPLYAVGCTTCYRYLSPLAIGLDGANNLYILNDYTQVVEKWAPGDTIGVVVAGGNGAGSAPNQFNNPRAMYVDAAGNIYVADHQNNRVQKWVPGATAGVTVAGGNGSGSNNNQVTWPTGVFVDGNGNVYVSDSWTNRVYKWAPGATTGVRVAGNASTTPGNGANQLKQPGSLYVDAESNLFIADTGNNRIQRWGPGTTSGTTVGPTQYTRGVASYEVNNITGIFMDSAGDLWLSDNINNRIQKYSGSVPATYLPRSEGSFTVTTTGVSGAATSNAVALYTIPSVSVTSSNGLYLCTGNSTTLQISETASATYQWQLNGSNLPNGTSASIQATEAGAYKITASSNGCTNSSLEFQLRVVSLPTISLSSSNNCVGSVLQLNSSDTIISKIEWKRNGVTIATVNRTLNTNAVTVAGGNGSGSGLNQLSSPQGMTVDANGNVYVAESGNHRITKWAPGATAGVVVAGGNGSGSGLHQLSSPQGITLNTNGDFYIADGGNSRIQKWNTGSSSGITVAGGNGSGTASNQLQGARRVALDNENNLYIYNGSSPNIRVDKWKIGASSGITIAGGNGNGSAANQLISAEGMYLDASGSLYLCDGSNYRVQKWGKGSVSGTTVAGGNGNGSAANQIQYPKDVFVDDLGNVYVTNVNGHKVTKWAAGATSGATIAGTGTSGSTADKLNSPNGIYVDSAYNLYLVDGSNYRVQLFKASTNRSFTATQSGVYTAVVTVRSGCQFETAPITIYDFPVINVSSSVGDTLCTGTNTVLSVKDSSAYTYQWINKNIDIAGANQSTLTTDSAGAYKVKVTGGGACSTISSAYNISVLPYPAAVISSADSVSICQGTTVTLNANNGDGLTYKWYKNGSAILDSVRSTLMVNSEGNYTVEVINLKTCSDTSNVVKVKVLSLPSANISLMGNNATFCQGSSLTINANAGTGFLYQWKRNNALIVGANSINYNAVQSGYYQVSVSDSNGCVKTSDSTQLFHYADPFSGETICAVTVDSASGKNQLIWQKTPGKRTQAYKIYRETAVSNQYAVLDTVYYNELSAWVDSTANSLQQSYSYKIAVVDSCGRESALSSLHKTIHLQSNVGINGEVNLSWSPYQGISYGSFYVMRSLGNGGYTQIGQISSSTTTFTDLNPPSGQKRYFIEIDVPGGCTPTARSSQVSRLQSNIAAISIGQPVTIRWIGCVSSDWTNAANWQGGILPGPNDVANINGVTCFPPAIPAGVTVYCKSVTLSAGVFLYIGPGAILKVME